MTSPRPIVVVLGVTGRLGPAVARAFDGWTVRGLSRRAPRDAEELPGDLELLQGDRNDVRVLEQLVEGATTVVDLLAFDRASAQHLLEAVSSVTAPPGHLVLASSMAEKSGAAFGSSESVEGEPADDYGRGKRDARKCYEERFEGSVHSLILPRLVAAIDPGRRDQPYLEAAAAAGRALHAGSGSQRQTVAPVEGVARVVRRLADQPTLVPPGPLNVGPDVRCTVRDMIAALLEGARLPAAVGRHPDPSWRAPHGGGDEVLDVSLLRSKLAELEWPDVLETYRRSGAWLAANPPGRRPLRLVSKEHKRFIGHRVVDVHGRRRERLVAEPIVGLEQLARWLSPAFYLDFGRPCNSACLYCAVPPHADTQGFTPVDRLAPQIAAGAAVGCDRAILIGGEPTIYPDLWRALTLLEEAGLGHEHVIMTNALRLADAAFLDELALRGVRTFHLSIDTADERVYDQLSRSSGQLHKQRAALDNVLSRASIQSYVYTAVTKLNADGLDAHLRRIAERADAFSTAPPPVLLAFMKPIGDALTHFEELMPSPEQRTEIARRAVSTGASLGLTVGFRNLQACLAADLLPHNIDYYLEDYSIDVETKQREPYAHGEHLAHAAACERCGHRALCAGIYTEDSARFGTAAYQPIDRSTLV